MPDEMSKLNRLVAENWELVKTKMTLPRGMEFPKVPGELLYGFLSNSVHVPRDCSLYVGNSADEIFKTFFIALARKFKVQHEVINDAAAAAMVRKV